MATTTLRQRGSQTVAALRPELDAVTKTKAKGPHPAGPPKHGPWLQAMRMLIFASWFNGCCLVIHATQFIGSPLYFFSRDYYYAYMAYCKACFALTVHTITQWFSPTTVRVSWDPELNTQFRRSKDGRLESNLPERIVLVANHQIYTDWLYLWWFAYTSDMHGHLFIILKETLKWIPVVGPGMMFFGFVFMSRKWATDKPRLQHRLRQLKTKHGGPMAGSPTNLDPMWLLIFPEGTNLSANTRKRSASWSETQHIPDLDHQLLPRSTGLRFCLDELHGTVDYIYDCTMAYEGIPRGGYAQDYFTLRSTFFQGRPPKSVNLYWRRFAVADVPTEAKEFDSWLTERWREKDKMLEKFADTERFPASKDSAGKELYDNGFVETEVRLRSLLEIGQIFAVLATVALVANVCVKTYEMFF